MSLQFICPHETGAMERPVADGFNPCGISHDLTLSAAFIQPSNFGDGSERLPHGVPVFGLAAYAFFDQGHHLLIGSDDTYSARVGASSRTSLP
jgi:hypothetical protein